MFVTLCVAFVEKFSRFSSFGKWIMQHLQNNILQFYAQTFKYILWTITFIYNSSPSQENRWICSINVMKKLYCCWSRRLKKTWCLKSWENLGSTEVLRNPGQKWMMLKDRVIRWGNFVWFRLVLEQTPKYRTPNTPSIECLNIELSEHHILAQNRTSNITKNWTVREHQTVHSKTIYYI